MQKSDIEIAQSTPLKSILNLGAKTLQIPTDALIPYGHYKAKIDQTYIDSLPENPNSKLILVTAISPTPAGEGKTTTTVGLGDALNALGKKTIICLREPSLGPVFGLKGGAAGGGLSQVVPMEDINLHFTGDFNAIQLAHNLLAAMIDNHIHHGNALHFDLRRVTWKRVLDMNDRALRSITQGLGGVSNGYPRESGFDIVVASEVMAILCLATSLQDLKEKLGQMICGYTPEETPIYARDLKAHGAMTALLKEALLPNLVQTLEHNPALVHGGPFANIAHGCNSVIATKAAMKMADFVVTEAGFGADLGAEKFINIKCRKAGLKPEVAVLVATIRALKYHGHGDDIEALRRGLSNLKKHVHNICEVYGLPCVVALNHFGADSAEEIDLILQTGVELNTPVLLAKHWAEGSAGAKNLAETVIKILENRPPSNKNTKLNFIYDDKDSILDKITSVATKVYGAGKVAASRKVLKNLEKLQAQGYGHLPICIAKTQSSFSSDPLLRGAPTGHTLDIREIRLCAGAGFVVVVCGEIMTMPGLPKFPAAENIDVDSTGKITGLF